MSRNDKGSLIRPVPLPESASAPVVTPLSPSVVYSSDTPDALDAQYEGRVQGYTYAREGHPNADVVARRMDALEGFEGGIVTGSGMAAVSAVLMGLLQTGDHVIGGNQLYGRSLRLMAEDLPRLGITTTLADPGDVAAVAAAIRPETKMILVEVVSNPTLRLADIAGLATLAREKGLLFVVDNTFTTPRGFRPVDWGADIVIQSLTKLLAGHSDVTLGYVAARDPALMDRMRVFAVTTGLTPSPFDCWLAERGLLTFDLRYDRAQSTAAMLADHLAGLPGVARVLYPLRADHPDRGRAGELLGTQGGNMVSFVLRGGRAEANAFTRAAQGLSFAPTLGDVGTTLSHPASSSHRALTEEARGALGITEGFFRVSVGLEEPDALRQVFTQAVTGGHGPGMTDSATLLAAAMAAVPLPALLVDRSERIVAANPDAQTLLGAQIEGRHFATILRQPPILEAIEGCLRDGLPRKAQYLSNDGAQDTTYLTTCRFIPGVGLREAGGVLISFQDVTHLEQAGQMRRDFVANVSHELRTPLTALMGFIETLRGPAKDDPAARARFLDIMEGEAARMNRLVGDLLSLSRVEGDERVRPTDRVDIVGLLRSTVHSLRPLGDDADVKLLFDPETEPVTITGDGDQLQQVFTNLVENAIKYGGSGGEVRITLSQQERDGALRGPSVRVMVSDDGPGIDPVHLPRLTERFYRADSHRSRELGGTGLGLAIVKHIVNRHRGRLRVSSDLGAGASFTVILPR